MSVTKEMLTEAVLEYVRENCPCTSQAIRAGLDPKYTNVLPMGRLAMIMKELVGHGFVEVYSERRHDRPRVYVSKEYADRMMRMEE